MKIGAKTKIATVITGTVLAIGGLVSQQVKEPTRILDADPNVQYVYTDQDGTRVLGVLDDKATLKANARSGKYRVEKTSMFIMNPPMNDVAGPDIDKNTAKIIKTGPDTETIPPDNPTYLPIIIRKISKSWPSDGDLTKRWRPAPGGVSVGHPDVTAGTLGGPICYNDNCYCFLTNSHVAGALEGAQIGDPMWQPGPYHGGASDDEIAKIVAMVAPKKKVNNSVDAAIACGDETTIYPEIYGIGKVTHIADVEVGEEGTKCGTRTKCSVLELVAKDVTVKIGYYTSGSKLPQMYTFVHQFLWRGVSDGGDSGGHIIEGVWITTSTDDGGLASLLFAGNDDGQVMGNDPRLVFESMPGAHYPGEAFTAEAYP